MKKSFIKAIEAVLSSAIVAASIASFNVSAASTNDYGYSDKMVELSRSGTFYIPEYDSYDIYNLASTEHYLAALPTYGTSLPSSFGVYFYINTNILPNSPTDSDLFTICPGYDGLASLGTVSSSTYSANCKRIFAKFTVISNPTNYSSLFTYYLEGVENNNAVNSEYNLHQMTSPSSTNPSSILYTNTGDTLVKSVFALGDVDRDGDVDYDDASAVQKYKLNNYAATSGRTTAEAAYDEAVFRLAADFNKDGQVNMADSVAIYAYANS